MRDGENRGREGEGRRKRKEKQVGVQKCMQEAREIERNHARMLKY